MEKIEPRLPKMKLLLFLILTSLVLGCQTEPELTSPDLINKSSDGLITVIIYSDETNISLVNDTRYDENEIPREKNKCSAYYENKVECEWYLSIDGNYYQTCTNRPVARFICYNESALKETPDNLSFTQLNHSEPGIFIYGDDGVLQVSRSGLKFVENKTSLWTLNESGFKKYKERKED